MHTDPELLGLLALGEHEGTDHARAHIATCADCTRELNELQQVVALGRAAGPDALAAPSPQVWDRICDELGFATSGAGDASSQVWHPLPETHATPAAGPDSAALAARADLVGAGAAWSHASGEAEVATDRLGRRILQLVLTAELPDSGVRQAWLVHREDPNQRQSIGILDGQYGVWTIDQAIDLAAFAVLEVSQQQAGETDYSGHSIARGEFALIS